MATKTAITADEFRTMNFDAPTELVRGELLTMNPPGMLYGVVCKNVLVQLELWVRETGAGYVAGNDTGVTTQRDPDTVRGADCLFVSAGRLPGGRISEGLLDVAPDLAVEVLSPGDRWSDVLVKVSEYLSAGVLEVWVLSPQGQRTLSIVSSKDFG